MSTVLWLGHFQVPEAFWMILNDWFQDTFPSKRTITYTFFFTLLETDYFYVTLFGLILSLRVKYYLRFKCTSYWPFLLVRTVCKEVIWLERRSLRPILDVRMDLQLLCLLRSLIIIFWRHQLAIHLTDLTLVIEKWGIWLYTTKLSFTQQFVRIFPVNFCCVFSLLFNYKTFAEVLTLLKELL